MRTRLLQRAAAVQVRSRGELRCRAWRSGRSYRVVLRPSAANAHGQALEIMMGLRLASCLRSHLWLIAPDAAALSGIASLSAEGVEVRVVAGWRGRLLEWLLLPRGQGAPDIHGTLLQLLRERVRDMPFLPARPEAASTGHSRFYKRLWLDGAPRLTIPAERSAALQAKLTDALGVPVEAPLVALDLGGEAGARRSEAQSSAEEQQPGPAAAAALEGYGPAIAWLQAQGFTVVRVGQTGCPPIGWPGVVDLTGSDLPEMLRLHCIARASFVIVDAPEHAAFGWALGRPVLTLNAADPVGAFPVRQGDIFTFALVRQRQDGRILAMGELLGPATGDAGDASACELVDNTPDEVLAAVQDMVHLLGSGWVPETPEQRELRLLVTRAGMLRNAEPHAPPGRGPHHSYLGRGRSAPSFARSVLA